jgi:hypothetical protein
MNCRSCDSADLFLAVNLGMMPIAESFLNNEKEPSYTYPTKMYICKKCGLGQLDIDIDRNKIFNDKYYFLSSKSNSVKENAQKFVDAILPEININDWVLEIGSNDGYLLNYFVKNGIDVLGIDPSKTTALYATIKNIPTVVDFFGTELAKTILKLKGYPKLIIVNNVLAHVPDIKDFMNGISILCNDDTIVNIENPSIMNIIRYNHFDTIYHEHYSYLSANAVNYLANNAGLNLFSLQKNSIQGESNKYILSKTIQEIEFEKNNGLFDENVWKDYSNNLEKDINIFYEKIKNLYSSNKVVCGYAASSKAVELLNFAKINYKWIKSIADDAEEKQNKFLPGLKIPIVSLEDMLKENPDEIIIFSWNLYNEILAKLKSKGYNGKIWKWDDK